MALHQFNFFNLDVFWDFHSFVHTDKLYVYQKESHYQELESGTITALATGKNIHVLNLKTLEWTTLEQKESYIEQKNLQGGLNGTIYHDNLLILGNIKSKNLESDVAKDARLCCWNIGIHLFFYLIFKVC